MLRLLTLGSAILALGAALIATGCGSTNPTQMRVINAISNNGTPPIALDVYVNGAKAITGVNFGSVYPGQATPAAYLGIGVGSNEIEAFDTTTTTNPIIGTGSVDNTLTGPTVSITSGNEYTIVLAGSVGNLGNNGKNLPAPYIFLDTDIEPKSGSVLFRVIDASLALTQQYSEGIDIYFEPNGAAIPPAQSPQISGLTFASDGPGYITLTQQPSYTVYATPHGTQTVLFSFAYTQNNQQISTLLMLDNPNGSGYAKNFKEYTDLN